MKQAKQRVIAIDYFRGVCILAVLLNHSTVFSVPLAYLVGEGKLWTSAAEMFLILSGVTFAVVRGGQVMQDFRRVVKKTWRRAGIIYLASISITFISLLFASLLMSHNLEVDVLGQTPASSGLGLVWSVFNLSYGFGWATFLMYYSGMLLVAPGLLFVLKTKSWLAVPAISGLIFLLNVRTPLLGSYSSFALWQIYFVIGLLMGHFRKPVIGWVFGLKNSYFKIFRYSIISLAGLTVAISVLLAYNLSPDVTALVRSGWLPVKFQALYIHLLNHKQSLDTLFMNERSGLLRPLSAVVIVAAGYLIYQKNKAFLLSRTGSFVSRMGSNTLAVFAAQAVAIPAIAAINVPRNILTNLMMTTLLVWVMYVVASSNTSREGLRMYISNLRNAYSQNKYLYLSRYEDGN